MSVIRKIDRVVNQLEITRSEAVEILVNTYISELMLSVSQPPKGKKAFNVKEKSTIPLDTAIDSASLSTGHCRHRLSEKK